MSMTIDYAEREAVAKESQSAILAKRPEWAEALIVAELHEDDSDSMSDYHNHKITRRVAIGWRKGKREDFRQLRAAAAGFEHTKHLGPGKGDFTIRAVWVGDCPNHTHYDGSWAPCGYDLDRKTFDNREEAEAAIAASTERFELHYDGIVGKVEYRIHEEEIEHRENYSMGGGNYLKSGYRHGSGWSVKSVSIGYLGGSNVFEDALPDPSVVPSKPARAKTPKAATPVQGNTTYRIEKHHHTKRGFDMWIVILANRLERDEFDRIRESCESADGWYSRQWGTTPGGFAFKSEETASTWAASLDAPCVVQSNETTETTSNTVSVDSGATGAVTPRLRTLVADRLRKLADGLQAQIDHKSRPLTQNWTHKRGREYTSRMAESQDLAKTQSALRALADAHEAGTVPPILKELRTKAAILPLMRQGWECGNNGYYSPTGRYTDRSAIGVALQELTDGAMTAEKQREIAQRQQANEIQEKENRLRTMNVPGFFPTPPALACQVIEAASIDDSHRVLEPSAGLGSLVEACPNPAKVDCVEQWLTLTEILSLKGFSVHSGDFLEIDLNTWTIRYDRVVMNPPFENGQDAEHVRHAYQFLNPGGRLVAIMSEGTFSRSDRRCSEFREWLDDLDHSTERIEPGAFTGASAFRQTGVACRMVVIDKPDSNYSEIPNSSSEPEELEDVPEVVQQVSADLSDCEAFAWM